MEAWAPWAAAAVALGGLLIQWVVTRSQHRNQRSTSLLDHRLRSCLELTDAVGELQRQRLPVLATFRSEGFGTEPAEAALASYNATVSRMQRALFEVRLTMPVGARNAAQALVDQVNATFDVWLTAGDGDPPLDEAKASITAESQLFATFEEEARRTLQSAD